MNNDSRVLRNNHFRSHSLENTAGLPSEQDLIIEIGGKTKRLRDWKHSLVTAGESKSSDLTGLLDTYEQLLDKLARSEKSDDMLPTWKHLLEIEQRINNLFKNIHLCTHQQSAQQHLFTYQHNKGKPQ